MPSNQCFRLVHVNLKCNYGKIVPVYNKSHLKVTGGL